MRGYQDVRLFARFMGNWDRSRRQEIVKTFKILEALEEVASGCGWLDGMGLYVGPEKLLHTLRVAWLGLSGRASKLKQNSA